MRSRRFRKPGTVSPSKTKPRPSLKGLISSKGSPMPPFVNTPLHDLESLWWLSVYLILPRSIVENEPAVKAEIGNPEGEGEKDKEDGPTSTAGSSSAHATQAIPQWVLELLVNQGERQISFRSAGCFLTQAQCLHESLAEIVNGLDVARKSLVSAYITAEQNIHTTGVDLTVVESVHEELAATYTEIRQSFDILGDLEFKPMPFSFVQPPSVLPDKAQGPIR
ncbi:hypothetical protein BDY19DRAFT_116298 [Irpex rosettiformis]|uniref:Uncharacterized protein n=1 Tax=Irpex rosettiformis TaxID=378272 RepID=A0ACB8U5Z5_9APHY|nr:hypothetical protein BDY19DRAFT_116298 [Irpex rosettiformis]